MTRAIDGTNKTGALLALPAILVVGGLLVFPVSFVFLYSFWIRPSAGPDVPAFDLANWHRVLSDPFYWKSLGNTLLMSAAITAVCAILAYPVAYLLTISRGVVRTALFSAILLPFWISYVIRTMSWLPVLGASGVVNRLLQWSGLIQEPIKFLFSDGAVILGLVHYLTPFMILTLFTGLEAIDKSLVPAARTLGCRPVQAFLNVTLPLSFPALASGSMLCFVLAAGSFISAEILGGPGDYLFSSLIYDQIIHRINWPLGSVLSIFLLAILGVLLLVYYRLVGSRRLISGLSQ
jgi:spermidine/putrescine transport system permease protein